MQNTGHAKSQKGVTAENGLRPFTFFTRCNEYYTNPKRMEVNEMPIIITAFLAGAKAGVELYNLFND